MGDGADDALDAYCDFDADYLDHIGDHLGDPIHDGCYYCENPGERGPFSGMLSHRQFYSPGGKCPRCGKALVSRRNKHTGASFVGCSGFPDCRFSR